MHYTAWPEAAWDYDGVMYARSMVNSQNGALTQYYMDREGVLYQITNPDTFVYHAGLKYSQESVGIEMPAGRQSDISPKMYENLAYFIADKWLENHPDDPTPSLDKLIVFVIGHGEITEVANIGDHGDFPLSVADQMAHISWDVLQMFAVPDER